MKSKAKNIIFIGLFVLVIFIISGEIYLYFHLENTVPVLGYHAILPHKYNTNSELTIDAEEFESQLRILKEDGYETLSLEEYYCWQRKECDKPHKAVLITFDDGYQNNYDYAFPLLKKYDMKATVFYIGKSLNKKGFMNKKTLDKSKEEYPNIEFASHTYARHEDVAKTYEDVINDDKLMKEVINSKFFAYPHGRITEEYVRALKDSGYKMAFTFGPKKEHRLSRRKDNPYRIPRLNISNHMPEWKFKLRLNWIK